MKHIISIIFICLTWALTSPDANAQGKPQKYEPKIEWNDSIEIEINMLSSKVDTINSSKLVSLNNAVNGKQDKLSSWMIFLFWLSIFLNIITLALVVYLYIKQSELKELKWYINKYSETYNKDKSAYNRYTTDVNTAFKILNDELNAIKQNINNLPKTTKTTISSPINYVNGSPFHIDNTPKEETVYFAEVIGNNGQFYFNKALPSRSGAIFKATKRGNQAEFEPLGLDVLWGNDNARKVIQFSGVATQNAQQMQVIQKGIVVLNGEYWDVQKNAHINLV